MYDSILLLEGKRQKVKYPFLLFVFLIFSDFVSAKVLLEQRAVKGIVYPGEVETFGLRNSFRLYGSNDVNGQTDKLVTATAVLEYGHKWDYYSLAIASHNIFFTPIFKTKFGREELETPIGDVADTKQFHLAQSFFIPLGEAGIRLQATAMNIDVKDHGFIELQRSFHKAIGSSFDLQDLDSVEHSQNVWSFQGEFLLPSFQFLGAYWGFGLGGGGKENFFFKESFIGASLVIKYSDNFVIYSRYMDIDQRGSDFFKNIIDESRYQYFIGLSLFGAWFPTLSYTSVYINGDDHGQMYFSPLNFNFSF